MYCDKNNIFTLIITVIANVTGFHTKIALSPYKYKSSEFPWKDLHPLSPKQARIFSGAWHSRIMRDIEEISTNFEMGMNSENTEDPIKRIDNYQDHPLKHIMNTINIIQSTFNAYPTNEDSQEVRYYAWQPIDVKTETKGNCQCILVILCNDDKWNLLTIVPSPYWSNFNIKPLHLLYTLNDLVNQRNSTLDLTGFYAIHDNVRFKLDWTRNVL